MRNAGRSRKSFVKPGKTSLITRIVGTAALLVGAMALALGGTPAQSAFALQGQSEERSVTLNAHEVTLAEGQQDFSIKVTVAEPGAYAGAEFSLVCGSGIQVKNVSYSVSGGSAGPVVDSGQTWFSYFSGTNAYSGTVAATINLRYVGSENSVLALNTVALYHTSTHGVTQETLSIGETVVIKRAGAHNDPPVITLPDNPGSDTPANTGNTNTVGGPTANGNNPPLSPLSLASDSSTETASGALAPQSPAANSAANAASNPGATGSLSSLVNQDIPLAANSTPEQGSSATSILASPLLWMVAGMVALALVVVGYAGIRRRHADKADRLSAHGEHSRH